MLQGFLGNAKEINSKELQTNLKALLIPGETIERAFKIVRDLFVFTDKCLILIDKQGISGKKVEFHSTPYKSISHFSVETAGTFDLDVEIRPSVDVLKIYEQRDWNDIKN